MDSREKLIKLYSKVRKNPSTVEEVILEAKKNELILRERKSSRVMSFITLKNDLILQKRLTEENVDSYLEDLKYCIENKTYLYEDSVRESVFKIFEIIAKIQYAYNLLGVDKSIRNLYENFLETYNENFNYYFEYFKGKEINFDYYQLSFVYNIYILFIKDYEKEELKGLNGQLNMKNFVKDSEYRNIMRNMLFYLKEFKLKNKSNFRKYMEIKKPTKYDFIY